MREVKGRKLIKTTRLKVLALVNQEYIKRIPFFVRGHATGRIL